MLQRPDRGWVVLIRSHFSRAAFAVSGSKCVSWGARLSPPVQICSVRRTIRNESPCGDGTALVCFTLESVRSTSQPAHGSEGRDVSLGVAR